MTNGKSVQLKPSQINKLKSSFAKHRVKNDFYKQHGINAVLYNRIIEVGKCSEKTFKKLF